MTLLNIVLGLVGLSLVVLIHELGHFVAARLMGVDVEAFSIGMGPRLVGFSHKGVDWRISAFPIGGFCKMKGEDSFRQALEAKADAFPREPGSFYGVHPLRRIVIAIAGPLANLIFAITVFILIASIGHMRISLPSRIVLYSEYQTSNPTLPWPADSAGLKTGDTILQIDGVPILDYQDLYHSIVTSADRALHFRVNRDGVLLDVIVTPQFDKNTGGGRIGIVAWQDPQIGSVLKNSDAALAGILPGDRILSIDGKLVRHVYQLDSLLQTASRKTLLTVQRGDASLNIPVVIDKSGSGVAGLGITFAYSERIIRSSDFPAAIKDGLDSTLSRLSDWSIGFIALFRGVNPFSALSGPARLVYDIGQSATDDIQRSGLSGLTNSLDFLGFISLVLFIMNLLPIPALDGGQILIFAIETLRRKSLKPISVYRYQIVGAIMILSLLVLSSIGDYIHYTGR